MLCTGELEKAIAIEPEPQNFSLLQGNVFFNGLKDKIICIPYAASHQRGNILFELSDSDFSDHRVRTNANSVNSYSSEKHHELGRQVITVESDTLDNILADLPEYFSHNIAVIWHVQKSFRSGTPLRFSPAPVTI